MLAPKNMTPVQLDWLARMRASLELLHRQWYGFEGNMRVQSGMDRKLFAEVNQKIRAAAAKLNLPVEDAAELEAANEGWDGEMYGPFVVLGLALDAITLHFVSSEDME